MIQHYLNLSWRRLSKFKTNTLINVFGLSVAITVCIIITMFSVYHLSFDKFVENGKNSFRLTSRFGDGTYNPNTFACFDDILPELTEVEDYTTCYINNLDEVFVGEKKFELNEAIFVNSSFYPFFSVKMREGTVETINQPNTVMLTDEISQRLFPEASPIGKTISLRSFSADREALIQYTVVGIVESLPETSHLCFDILLSQKGHFTPTINTVKHRKVLAASVYMKLFPNVEKDALTQKLADRVAVALEGVPGPPADAINFNLQPLHDIHFATDMMMSLRPTIRSSVLNILILVGLIVFVIASVNFLNLFIAQSAFYRRESGIIQFLGGRKSNLFGNFFFEILISVTISFALSLLLLLAFKKLIPTDLFNWSLDMSSKSFWLAYTSFFPVIIIFIALFSLLNFSGLMPKAEEAIKKGRNRKMVPLVVFQYIIVIALMAFTFLVNKQLSFIKNKSLGYNPENILIINMPQQNNNVALFRDKLKNSSAVKSASSVMHYPGYRLQDMDFTNQGISFPFKFGRIDQYGLQTMDIKVLKYFSPEKDKATDGWYINNSFYQNLKSHYTDEQIAMGNFPFDETGDNDPSRTKFVILGVMDDFNYASLHSPIEDFAFLVTPEPASSRLMLVRFEQAQLKDVLASVNAGMNEIFPGFELSYSFLDEELASKYQSEQTLMRLINSFSALAILIACMGLVGLSIFISENRRKEIGIRKVSGAKISEILTMLNKDFAKWVTIAFVIAIPIAYYAMFKWMENFAYKAKISWWIFALAGVIALVIAIITVSWQSWKAANKNPVEALRYE